MGGSLFFAVADVDRLDVPLAESLGEALIALEPPHHGDSVELLFVERRAPHVALVVEEFEQCSEALGVTVVWGGRKEQLVLEVGTDLLDEGGSLAIAHPTPTWGDVVALIDDEHAESPWEARCPLWDEVFEDAENVVLLEEVIAATEDYFK